MTIHFKKIDHINYDACINLSVGKDQLNYVASNAYSLVQAFYEQDFYPMGIYHNNMMVGFILYDYDPEISGWSFSRFMIDIKHQNKGYGSQALEAFLIYFHEFYPKEDLYTSVEVENKVAIDLYIKNGFKKLNDFEYTINDITYHEFRLIKQW